MDHRARGDRVPKCGRLLAPALIALSALFTTQLGCGSSGESVTLGRPAVQAGMGAVLAPSQAGAGSTETRAGAAGANEPRPAPADEPDQPERADEGDDADQANEAAADAGADSGAPTPVPPGKFSFFVTSLAAMRELSGSQSGFGGDLRFGKDSGLEGADEICRQTAERAVPGAGAKTWRAFLSTTAGGPNGGPINAIDRVGQGPWYDRLERLVAMTKEDLAQPRPRGADPVIINDLPNEDGIPNHLDGAPGCSGSDCPDNHMVLTGSNTAGLLREMDPAFTCNDWTSALPEGSPWCGASWPRGSRGDWASYAADSGCAPCVEIVERGGPQPDERCVGSAGGYGAIYCFALTP